MTDQDAPLPPGCYVTDWPLPDLPRGPLPPGWTVKGFEDDLCWLGDSVVANAETDVLPPGCEDSVWILHNQYVCPPNVDPGALADEDSPNPYPVAPPPEFVRVMWKEVADIKGVPLRGAFWDGLEVPPCFRWDAFLSWREASLVLPGAEFVYQPVDATIGQVELEALLPLLRAATTTDRMEAIFHAEGPFEDDTLGCVLDIDSVQHRRVFSFKLDDLLPTMLRPAPPSVTPEFWWPEDRAWVVWTDWDLLGSKVFGSRELIEELRRHPDLETLDWFPVRVLPPSPPAPPGRLEIRAQELREKQRKAAVERLREEATRAGRNEGEALS